MSQDAITQDLRTVLKRLKLSRLLPVLPERFALARQQKMPHQDFLVLILQDGTFDMVWQDLPDDSCGGTYGVSGDRVQFVAADDLATWTCGGESLGMLVLDAAWSLEGDQLVLSDFSVSPEPDITWWNAGFFSKPLTRVAG